MDEHPRRKRHVLTDIDRRPCTVRAHAADGHDHDGGKLPLKGAWQHYPFVSRVWPR